ncbi:uncharacterized protein LOC107042667 [Diachasma alloeum]|uniref:uncharacterized protein LOC107042667 n=1 Tax=Diachasma alloeum TaxID=454923 RepID=UPI0007384FB7|nr:uncharacterized protein LOC107042667 [Diachasma alloeum]
MQSDNLKKETDILRNITQASNAIRRKHKMIKLGRETTERAMSEVFKPVITPLEKLVDQSVMKEPLHKIKKEKTFSAPIRMKKDEDDDDDSEYKTLVDFPFSMEEAHSSTPMRKISPIKAMTPTDRILSIKLESPTASQKHLEMYLNRYNTEREDSDLDKEFGVRRLQEGMKIGDSLVTFHGDSMTLKGEKYTLTPGLIELIFQKSPNMSLITETDKHTYGNIIQSTNAYRKYYKPNGALRTITMMKYHSIIEDIIKSKKTGMALPHYMIASAKPRKMDYVYWDNPNELVDRLRLLMASQSAGNMSHTNEIMSIIEELREANIIY